MVPAIGSKFALKQANENLEIKVVERTGKLQAVVDQPQAEATEPQRAEVVRRQSEQRYHSLVVATSQMVWKNSADGQVVDLSQLRTYTGQSQEEVKNWG